MASSSSSASPTPTSNPTPAAAKKGFLRRIFPFFLAANLAAGAQWQELENQALIFKHFLAGVPVPPNLLLSVRRSFGSSPACFYTNPTLSYYSYFGKKFDPEPGRCRRTDGKKWRCARDAYPDSKYCERHMHRGKTRSRKPVESQTLPQLQSSSSSSTVTTSFTPSGPTNRCFQNDSLKFSITGGCSDHSSKLDKDYSYLNVAKTDVDIHTFIPEASGKSKGFVIDSAVDSSVLSYPQLQKSSYIGNEFDFLQPMEQESSSVRPFFDEWPKTRDAWSDFEAERWNQTSLSNTQLSISIPMPSSDFPSISSRFSIDD